jgi:hypothetical protein
MALISCHAALPITREDVIGTYEYHQDNGRDKSMGTTCFILNPDGAFTAGDASFAAVDGPVLPKTGRWVLWNIGQGPDVDLEHAGFPLERHGSSIRALVNDDLGYFCELKR